MEKPDIVFQCKKCGHLIFTPNVIKLLKTDCPRCGEEPYVNWILKRRGDYDLEYTSEQYENLGFSNMVKIFWGYHYVNYWDSTYIYMNKRDKLQKQYLYMVEVEYTNTYKA